MSLTIAGLLFTAVLLANVSDRVRAYARRTL